MTLCYCDIVSLCHCAIVTLCHCAIVTLSPISELSGSQSPLGSSLMHSVEGQVRVPSFSDFIGFIEWQKNKEFYKMFKTCISIDLNCLTFSCIPQSIFSNLLYKVSNKVKVFFKTTLKMKVMTLVKTRKMKISCNITKKYFVLPHFFFKCFYVPSLWIIGSIIEVRKFQLIKQIPFSLHSTSLHNIHHIFCGIHQLDT